MGDLGTSVTAALGIVKKLKSIADHIKDAEFKNLVADLNLELADMKMKLADVVTENATLKAQIQGLSKVQGDPCPRCHRRAWSVVDSKPDTVFGDLGGLRRTYRCSVCHFSEERLEDPK